MFTENHNKKVGWCGGGLAQMVERSLSMREVPGSNTWILQRLFLCRLCDLAIMLDFHYSLQNHQQPTVVLAVPQRGYEQAPP